MCKGGPAASRAGIQGRRGNHEWTQMDANGKEPPLRGGGSFVLGPWSLVCPVKWVMAVSITNSQHGITKDQIWELDNPCWILDVPCWRPIRSRMPRHHARQQVGQAFLPDQVGQAPLKAG